MSASYVYTDISFNGGIAYFMNQNVNNIYSVQNLSPNSSNIVVIDALTNAVTKKPLPILPVNANGDPGYTSIVVNPVNNRYAYLTYQTNGTAHFTVYDLSTNVSSQYDFTPSGESPISEFWSTISSTGTRLYCTDANNSYINIYNVDGSNVSLQSQAAFSNPIRLYLSSDNSKLYITYGSNGYAIMNTNDYSMNYSSASNYIRDLQVTSNYIYALGINSSVVGQLRGIIYVYNTANNLLNTVDISASWVPGSNPYYITVGNSTKHLYISDAGNGGSNTGQIYIYDISSPANPVYYSTIGSGILKEPTYIVESNSNVFYVANQTALSPNVYFVEAINITYPVTCFKEDTQILTFVDGQEVYKPIQSLRKGDLVKTFENGYKAIDMIGRSQLQNPGTDERIKDRLYKLTSASYPELFEDLYITGCHSILVDHITDEHRSKLMEVQGDIFVTERKYRLIACVDERATPYNNKGEFTIYHIALENDSIYKNYGVYANGLLVETTSKRWLKELSNMELL